MNPGISAVGMALNVQFERPSAGLKLTAHRDTAGNWQIGDGITVLPDGTPVRPGMVLTDEQYAAIAPAKMQEYVDGVRRLVNPQIKLNQYQFDALVLLAYNIGVGALASSSVMENVNAGRFADAAYHFGDWVYARHESKKNTKTGQVEWAQDPNGNPMPIGVKWFKAYRGLYRRHCAEACLFLGYDWHEACHEDRIELNAAPEWQPEKNRWKDIVNPVGTTKMEDIFRIARKTPLPPLDPTPETSMTADDVNYVQYVQLGGTMTFEEFMGVKADTSGTPAAPPPVVPEVKSPLPPVAPKAPSAKTKTFTEARLDPNAGIKPLDESDRAKGYLWQQVGMFFIQVSRYGIFGTGVGGAAEFVAGDAVLLNAVMSMFVPAALTGTAFTFGYVAKHYGNWKRSLGEQSATQALS